MLKYHISSGQGPVECELAVKKFLDYLIKNYSVKVLEIIEGENKNVYKSVVINSDDDLSEYLGSIKWVCQSTYRPLHKRKNWFINFSICNEHSNLKLKMEDLKYETFRSGGPGGQHVNTTDSGVRVIHMPTGIVSSSTQERSQYMNKKLAIRQLEQIFSDKNKFEEALLKTENWEHHRQLERGNAVCVFKGPKFKKG